jgi:spermidine/putrescine transport system substrate-binding protein
MARSVSAVSTWGLIIISLVLVACSGDDEAPAVTEVEPTEAAPETLTIYNWDTYIDPEIFSDFEQEFELVIDYQIFDNDIDMMEELRAGVTDYDLVVPSDFTVSIMRDEGLLTPLNKENIPNFGNVDQTFISPVFDPANRYCAPYQWGTVGIGYNIERTGSEISGWSDIFNPRYAGRVALLDDYRTTMGIALLMLGYSPNTTNVSQIAEATEFLRSYSRQIGVYAGDDAQDLLLDGEYDIVMEWSGDIFQLMEDNPDIRYVIPEEGSIIWTDNICIPAGAANQEMAELFINYILNAQNGARLSNYVQYGSPNWASLPFINSEDLNNPAIYPPDAVRERLFFLVDVNLAANDIYEQAWEEVLSDFPS